MRKGTAGTFFNHFSIGFNILIFPPGNIPWNITGNNKTDNSDGPSPYGMDNTDTLCFQKNDTNFPYTFLLCKTNHLLNFHNYSTIQLLFQAGIILLFPQLIKHTRSPSGFIVHFSVHLTDFREIVHITPHRDTGQSGPFCNIISGQPFQALTF